MYNVVRYERPTDGLFGRFAQSLSNNDSAWNCSTSAATCHREQCRCTSSESVAANQAAESQILSWSSVWHFLSTMSHLLLNIGCF